MAGSAAPGSDPGCRRLGPGFAGEPSAFSLTAELTPRERADDFALPDAVEQALAAGPAEGEEALSEDVFRLLSAWTGMSREESFTADVELGVECGPLDWDETIRYGQILVEGNRVSCVRKDDAAVYFAGDTFWDRNGTVLTSRDTRLVDRARFLEVLKQVCMKGTFSCTDTGKDTWLYTLQLDQAAMQDIAWAADPEMESMPVTLSGGSLQLTVSGDTIKEIDCACTGGLTDRAAAVCRQQKAPLPEGSRAFLFCFVLFRRPAFRFPFEPAGEGAGWNSAVKSAVKTKKTAQKPAFLGCFLWWRRWESKDFLGKK